jgi:hypothetical protein
MPLTDDTLNQMGTYLAPLLTHLSLHSADPGPTGTDNLLTTAARAAVTWQIGATGDLQLSDVAAFTGAPASTAVAYVAIWDDPTAGTYRGSVQLTGDDPSDLLTNDQGDYTVSNIYIDAVSSS